MSGSLSSGSDLEGSGSNGSVNGSGSVSGSGSNPPTTHWDDGGVLVVLIINIVLSIVFFFFWVFFMRTRRSSGTPLFPSEEMEPEGSEDITKDNTRFAWIVKLFRIDDEEMMNVAGVDASIYLRFQRMLIGFFLLLTIIGVPFVALNLNGGAVMTVGSFQFVFHGFITTTADNMEKGSSLLWFHALFTALVSLLSYGLILWLSVTYKRNSYHPDRIDVRSFTCLIEDFPKHIGGSEDETRLKMYFEQLYRGGIYQVYILNDLRVLNKIHELQKKQHRYQSKAQHYELIYARTNVRPILTEGFWERLRHNYKRICCCSGKNYDEIRGKDAMDFYQGKARALQAQVVEYRRLLQQLQQRPYEQSRGVGLALVTFKTISGAKRCARDFATSEPPPPIASVGRRRGQNDDQQRIEEKRRTFDQLQISTWKVKKAPHPGDVRWRCLLIPPWKVWLRIALINTVVFAFMFFFTTPLAIVGGLQQFILRGGGEEADIPNLVAMMRTSWFEGLITGFLPTILLAFLSFLIPFTLEGWPLSSFFFLILPSVSHLSLHF
jgi:hypothetical protein